MSIGFDKLAINHQLLFGPTFEEMTGLLAHDRAKPEHTLTLHGAPAWSSLPNGRPYLDFDSATHDYLDCPAADTADLDFTTGPYTIAAWVYLRHSAQSQLLIGRYGLDLDGWEVVLDDNSEVCQLRHMHGSLPTTRTGCYSDGWVIGSWELLIITRSGAYPLMYKTGVPLDMTYDTGGLSDPDTCNRDLVVGARYTKDANWLDAMLWYPRIWGRALTPAECVGLTQEEGHWFGV